MTKSAIILILTANFLAMIALYLVNQSFLPAFAAGLSAGLVVAIVFDQRE